MFSTRFRRYFSVLQWVGLVIATILLISACQTRDSARHTLHQQSPSIDCRVVNHADGETTICGEPDKVAALEPKVLSLMVSLGVQPSAYADSYLVRSPQFDNPDQQIPYLGQFVTSTPINLGDRSQPSLEKLAQLKPDLILGINAQKNTQLSVISPTILLDTETLDWQENIQIVAKALKLEDNVQPVIDSHQQQLAEVRSQLAPLVNTYPRVLNLVSSQIMDYIEIPYPKHSGDLGWLLEEVGFQLVLPEGMEQTPGLRKQISREILAQLDADIIFVQTWLDDWDGTSAYNILFESLRQKWTNDPLLHNSRAWQEGKVYFVDYTLWGGVISGPIADTLMMKKLPDILS